MAGRAIIGDAHGRLGVVAPIVTSEAPRVIIVPEIVRVRSPRNLHKGKYIAAIDGGKRFRGLSHLGLLGIPPSGRICVFRISLGAGRT